MNIAHKHHYVPKFHLANFTLKGRADDRLWVFDQAQNRQWPSTPENSGHKRHFHKIDLPSIDPMAVETGFGAFESDVAPVIRQVITTRSIPSKHRDFELFITFIALLINRVPAIRQRITDVADEVRAKEVFVRNWLRQSDNPVAITWTARNTGPWPPGFGHRHTQVSCPLSRRVLLVGSFEGQPGHAPLDALAVATANSCARRNANQLYSGTEDFVWLMQEGRIGTKADLVRALSTARE